MAPSALVRHEHVGETTGHLHDGRAVPREIPGRPGHGSERPGTRGARHPYPRRPPLRRRYGRALMAPLPLAAMGRVLRRLPAIGGNALALAEVSTRDTAERDRSEERRVGKEGRS